MEMIGFPGSFDPIGMEWEASEVWGPSAYNEVTQYAFEERLADVNVAAENEKEETTEYWGGAKPVPTIQEFPPKMCMYEFLPGSLGTGFFGDVRKARHKLSGQLVAVKTLNRKQYEKAGLSFPPEEVTTLRRLRHPNILTFLDAIAEGDDILLITELLPRDMFHIVEKGCLTEDECRVFARQLVSGVAYLHGCRVCHRDLKPENVMFDEEGTLKIIDFGFSCNFDPNRRLTTFCGSPDYAAPELWKRIPYVGPEVDVWAIGVMLFIFATGYVPFNTANHVVNYTYSWPPEANVSYSLRELIHSIFKPQQRRLSIEGVRLHGWLNNNGRLPPVSSEGAPLPTAVDETALTVMDRYCIDAKRVTRAVLQGECNELTAAYKLLCKKRKI